MGVKVKNTYGQTHVFTREPRLRKFGVPPSGPLDPFTADLARAALLLPDDSPVIEVKGSLDFEATKAMTMIWMTPLGGYTKKMTRFETHRVSCVGEFAGYLSYCYTEISDRRIIGLWSSVRQLRYLPITQRKAFSLRSTLDISRVGFRFESDLLPVEESGVSEPACPGLIQLTPSGQVIILGPDGPVTGGYQKLGTVIEADLPLLATLIPKQTYQMIPVGLNDAMDARKEMLKGHSETDQVDANFAIKRVESDAFPSVAG